MPKLLIVEDEPSVAQILTDKFQSEKFTVLRSHNGEEGLKMALKNKPDIILLDLIMPKMDGLTMLKKLREDKWGKNAQVIVLTNLSDGASIEAAMKDGVYDFLVKADWKIGDLVKKVKEKLGLKK
jgi:DNA-binding response OmpR family regulator